MNLPPDQALLGRLAVHYKLLTPDQLNAAMRHAGHQGTNKLADVLRDLGFLTPKQLDWLSSAQQQYLAKQRAAQGSPAAESPPQTSAPPRPAPTAPEVSPVSRPVVSPALSTARPAAETSGALQRILARAVQLKASDVHLHAGSPIQVRIHGKLKPLEGESGSPDTEKILLEVLTAEQRKHFEENLDLDFAYSVSGAGRFRANIYRQQRGIDGVFRPIPPSPPTLEELGLPPSLGRLTSYHQGLVLVTGPAGCGKSSTMAALVNLINEERADHVITVEDPIEYVHVSKRAVINQRQVLTQTASFGTALRASLREDPDVIVIGELRDLETISLAISAAETGHLVMATLHTNNSIRTVNRILDVFPPKQQSQIRAMVSESLRAIISQRLLPTVDGSRRVPALEILLVKPAISNLIREQKTFQIRSILQTARSEGMVLLDDSLAELVKTGAISKEVARRHCEDIKRFL
jgi:twitching motility protein PilT